ncbi:MAG: CapA family protein [Candidatus Dojkabacteria bacterium]|nr:MAG: CapA family protein [Candidatus Dojkabacteria bacterium]
MPTYNYSDRRSVVYNPNRRAREQQQRSKSQSKPQGKPQSKHSGGSLKRILGYTLVGFVALNIIGAVFFNNTYRSYINAVTYKAKEFQINYRTYKVQISEDLPEDFAADLQDALDEVEYKGKKRYEFVDGNADLQIGYGSIEDEMLVLSNQVLLPVVNLYSLKDSTDANELNSSSVALVTLSSYESIVTALFPDQQIIVVENTADIEWLDSTIAIVMMSDLTADLKLLSYEGVYYLDSFDSGSLPASLGVIESSADDSVGRTLIGLAKQEVDVEQELTDERVLKLNMTGVTALSRNLAFKIDASGDPAYAATKISDFLADADLTHTSNEVSFIDDCVPVRSMSFCSNSDYLAALDAIGLDIIELTGNHNNDYGAVHNTNSIGMYKERGWSYFGGGLDSTDAAKILYKEVDGTKLAFIGYNYYDTMNGSGALASASRAGANSFSFEKMEADIKAAKEAGAVVIVDFQFQECYSYPASDVIFPPCYKALTSPDQVGVFRQAVEDGADIVVGTQAHQPQTFEVYNGKTIFYGLGNLFFDQIPWIGTRQGLVLTHYFVDGKHVQTKVSTTIYDNDMRPYVTEGEDRELLLGLLEDARASL